MTDNALINVDAFKAARPAQAFAALSPTEESLADGIGSSYGVLGYKGRVWSLRHRGETYYFKRPDDGSPLAYLDVIILRQAHAKSKSFYPQGSYVEGQSDGRRPLCTSIDGVTPDGDAQQKQSNACAICPRNEWKTYPDGRKGRDCTDYKRLAVLVLPNLSAALFNGQPLMEPVFLRIPPASLNDLATFGETMGNQGWHFASFITRISFDPTVSHPKMTFRALQPLTDNEAPIVLPMREEAMTKRIVGEGPVLAQLAAPAPQQAQAVQTGFATVNNPPQNNVVTLAPNNQHAAIVTAPVTPAPTPQPATVDTGFGLVNNQTQTAAPQPQAPQPAALDGQVIPPGDVGALSMADAELSAKIAGMFKTPA